MSSAVLEPHPPHAKHKNAGRERSSPAATSEAPLTSSDEDTSRREKLLRLLRWCSAPAAVALALAGCGGGGGPGAASPTASTPTQLEHVAAHALARQSATARTTLPQRAARAAVSAETATEDFENGMSGWQNWGNAHVVAGAGTSGSQAMQVGTAAGGAGLPVPGIVPGTAYRLTAQVKVSDPSDPVFVGVNILTSSGNHIVGHSSPAVSSTGYATVTVDLVAPANSAWAVVWVWKNDGPGQAYLDDVSFGPPTSPPPPPPPPPASNLLSNGGFESGMANWVDWGNASAVPGHANSGGSALSVGTAAGGAGQTVGGITAGSVYRLVAQAKVSDPSDTVFVGVNLLNQAGAAVAQMALPVSSTTYGTVTFDITAPADAASAVVYVWKNAGSGFGLVDDVVFGLVPDAAPPPPPASSGNLALNGGFENGLFAWVNWGNTVVSTGQAAAGSYAAQVGTAAGGLGQSVTGIVPGNTYRAVAQVKVSSADETGYLGLKFVDAAGNSLQDAAVPFSSTSYSSAQVELVAPPNATTAVVYAWKNAGSGFAFVDQAQLRGVAAAPSVVADANAGGLVAVLNDGTRVAAWSDDTGLHTQRFDANGALVGSSLLIAPSGSFLSLNGVAGLTGGGYVVQYTQPGAVLVQVVSAAGALAGEPAIVRTQAQVEADLGGEQDTKLVGGAGVFPLADGGFGAFYRVTNRMSNVPYTPNYRLMRQRFDALGSAVGTPETIAWEYPGRHFTIAPTPRGGHILAGMTTSPTAGDGRAVISVNDGVNVGEIRSPEPGTYNQYGAGLSNGTYIGIWTSHLGFRGQLFAVDGGGTASTRTLGPPVTFTTPVRYPDTRLFGVTGLAGGGFLLSWWTSGQYFAQAFDANAQPVGGMMPILAGSIAATPDGGFVVVARVGAQFVQQHYPVSQ